MEKFILIIIFVLMFGFSGLGQEKETKTGGSGSGQGRGVGSGSGNSPTTEKQEVKTPKTDNTTKPTKGLNIISKPRAAYTDLARQNKVEGNVVLRVKFQKNGSIGKIKVITGLGDGLTESAIAAAKKIRFEPATKKGKPYTVTKNIQYNFTVY